MVGNRHAILRVGGGIISSHSLRLRSLEKAHNSSKQEIVGFAPAAEAASLAIAVIVALKAGNVMRLSVIFASRR